MDFAKAFDKVPHKRLIQKLQHCNLHDDAIGWIASFLNNRTQRVVVDGHTSTESPVLSGVPQGSVLGPVLFLIFINDIAKSLHSSVRLFADDCLLYREIKSKNDQFLLQEDLNTLVNWSKTWGMQFNIKKCNILSITLKKKKKLSFTYKMEGQKVAGIRDTKYLGVTFTSDLKWDTHIANISSAANRMLGFLRRNLSHCPRSLKEKAYKSYVRPKVEYCSSIWDPHQAKDIKRLEMVQHRAARYVTNTPYKRTDQQVSVSAMVKELGWQPLEERRRNNRLQLLFKVTNNLVEIPLSYHPTLRDPQPRRGNNRQYQRPHSEVNAFHNSFFPRTISDWNGLCSSAVAADSLESFRRCLF